MVGGGRGFLKSNHRVRSMAGLAVIALFVAALDQLSKHLVAARLDVGQSGDILPILSKIIRVTYVTNTGVAFGLFPGVGEFFISVVAIVVLVILLYYWHLSGDEMWLMRIALGFQLGGALGNLADRVRLGGAVRDFIDLNFWPLQDWPIFNLADAAIVTGVSFLVLLMLWEECSERSVPRPANAEADVQRERVLNKDLPDWHSH